MLEGFQIHPGYLTRSQQEALLNSVRNRLKSAPLYQPVMPRTGQPLNVRMSNLGPYGWVSDISGYRYDRTHPETRAPWPDIPEQLLQIWSELAFPDIPPEACLVNLYRDNARLGLHIDQDEADRVCPVISISLGDSALFRIGGLERSGPTRSVRLSSGDVVVLGGPARMAYHGVDRIYPGTSTLLTGGGRLNLTLRRVTPIPNSATSASPQDGSR